jgi:hypothetical protein
MEPTGEQRLARIREVTHRRLHYYATAYLNTDLPSDSAYGLRGAGAVTWPRTVGSSRCFRSLPAVLHAAIEVGIANVINE